MAKWTIILPFLLISAIFLVASSEDHFDFPQSKAAHKLEYKLHRFTVYWVDKVGGTDPTAVTIVDPSNSTSSNRGGGFGMVRIMDNLLTLEPMYNGTEVGRARGFYAATALESPLCFFMAMSFQFTRGKYNGSSLSLVGINPATSLHRELPINGGTGLFRFAQGFAELSTKSLDLKTGNAIVQYNITVLHY